MFVKCLFCYESSDLLHFFCIALNLSNSSFLCFKLPFYFYSFSEGFLKTSGYSSFAADTLLGSLPV